MKALIFIVSIIVIGSFSAQAKTINDDKTTKTVVIPIYAQKVSFNIPLSWKLGFEEAQPDSYIIEFIPKDENIETWQSIISVQGFKGLASKIPVEKFLLLLASRFQKTCGKELIFIKSANAQIDGHPSASAIIGCSKMPSDHASGVKKGQSEVGLYYAVKGSDDIYLIHKSIREDNGKASLTSETIGEFIAPILPIQICKKGGAATECIK